MIIFFVDEFTNAVMGIPLIQTNANYDRICKKRIGIPFIEAFHLMESIPLKKH